MRFVSTILSEFSLLSVIRAKGRQSHHPLPNPPPHATRHTAPLPPPTTGTVRTDDAPQGALPLVLTLRVVKDRTRTRRSAKNRGRGVASTARRRGLRRARMDVRMMMVVEANLLDGADAGKSMQGSGSRVSALACPVVLLGLCAVGRWVGGEWVASSGVELIVE